MSRRFRLDRILILVAIILSIIVASLFIGIKVYQQRERASELVSDANKMVVERYDIQSKESSFKSWMDYRTITDESSDQYQLLHNSSGIRFCDDGLIRYQDYIGVALSEKFGKVGDLFYIELESGKMFKAIKVEVKSEEHLVDNESQYIDGSIIEFVVNSNKIPHKVIFSGNYNDIEMFEGNVKSIYKLTPYTVEDLCNVK